MKLLIFVDTQNDFIHTEGRRVKMKFLVGDYVKCLEDIELVDGKKHAKGEEFQVTEENLDYFNDNANNNLYFLVRHASW